MNRIIDGSSVYNAERFAKVALTEDITEIMSAPNVVPTSYLNRLLLDALWPDNLVAVAKRRIKGGA